MLFQSLLRIMNLRKYSGLVQFVPAPGYEGYGEPIKQIDYHKDETTCSQEGQESNVEAQTQGYPGPQIDFQTTEWRALDGPFISVWINNVPWASENVMPAPDAKVIFLLFFNCNDSSRSAFDLSSTVYHMYFYLHMY